LNVNLLGKAAQFGLDSQGRLITSAQLISPDGKTALFMNSGTRVVDKDGKPLQSLEVSLDYRPPMPPEGTDVIGLVYNIAPTGARFNPSLQLTFSYGPDEISAGSSEGNLYAALYDNSTWDTILYKRIDTTKHTFTTTIDRCSELAVLLPLQMRATAAPAATAAAAADSNAVKVVVVGTLAHGPMQPTVQAIKDVLSKYGTKVEVSWVDLMTRDGAAYAKANNITAHMNVIINGKVTYMVNGKSVTFQWFEGQQWTRQDLDNVLGSLVSK